MARIKSDRLMFVKNIILNNKISCQDELQAYLAKEGYYVTQATLSRDIKELKIAKIADDDGKYYYKLHDSEVVQMKSESAGIMKLSVLSGIESLEFSGQMAVIKTNPGYASVAAGQIDNIRTKEIMGTIAGDDTVLLILREGADRNNVVRSLTVIVPDISSKLLINKI